MRKIIGLMIFLLIAFALIGCEEALQTASTPTLSGLVARYALDESCGLTTCDSCGNNPAGTISGAAWTAGKSGHALSFDGTNDFVRIPGPDQAAPSQIANLSEGSISLWFKFEGSAGSSGMFYPLFYLGPSPDVTDTREGLIIEIGHKGIWNNSQELFYTVTVGTREPILCFDSGFNLTPGEWYHFVVTVSTAGNTGYLNGFEITSREYNFADSSGTEFLSSVTNGILALGCGRSAIDGQFYYFKGVIDEVQIYNRPLSVSEVRQLYQP